MRTQASTILVYAQDSIGLGHVSRALAVLRHILAAHARTTAVLATRSPMPDVFELPPRCDFIKLPVLDPIAVSPPERPAAGEHLQLPGLRRRYLALRKRILVDAALELAPSLMLVDNNPAGRGDELREGLYALKGRHPSSRLVVLIQDIVGDPDSIRKQWQERGVYQILDTLYDDILVCSNPQFWDVAEQYALSDVARSKLHYCGFIVRDVSTTDQASVRQQFGLSPSGPVVVVTVGGGQVGYPLLEASLEALKQLRTEHPNLEAVLVTGPLMAPEQYATLLAQADVGDRVLRQADNFQLLAAADAVVSMSGYNSVAEALALARPLVVVPLRGNAGMEQSLRAEVLSAQGLARCIPLETVTGTTIADAMRWALARDANVQAARVRELGLTFDGAATIAHYLAPWVNGD